MKKINALSESDFLKLFFGFLSAAFLIAAALMPDRASMLSGLWQILSQPCKLTTNFFAVGGYAATFLNMGLVTLCCLGLFVVFKAAPNNVSTLAVILTAGFSSWGIHIINIWPTIFGVLLYCLIKKQKFSASVNAMLFSTGIAPLISDLMLRYPYAEAVGYRLEGVLLALMVGAAIGFFLIPGLNFSPKVHQGFDLYSAALPVGLTAFFLNALLFKTLGVSLPAGADSAQLTVASGVTVNGFCLIFFGLCVILALAMGCRPKDYWKLLSSRQRVSSISGTCGNAVFLMNVGVFGLFILGYYNLIGASFNGVTMGIIFCMLATCNSGSHPGNVMPIMIGYFLASLAASWCSARVGGAFNEAINAQAICVGLCFANGLSPITDTYGWGNGMIAAGMHYVLVTSVPLLHGGYCLYNGGFTAAIVCIILIPVLGQFSKTRQERLEKKR